MRVFHRVPLSLVAHRPESDARSRVLRLKLVVVTIKIKPAFNNCISFRSLFRFLHKPQVTKNKNSTQTLSTQQTFLRTHFLLLRAEERHTLTHTFTRARLITVSKRATPLVLSRRQKQRYQSS